MVDDGRMQSAPRVVRQPKGDDRHKIRDLVAREHNLVAVVDENGGELFLAVCRQPERLGPHRADPDEKHDPKRHHVIYGYFHARIPRITFPCTSVSRRDVPLWL